MLGPRGLRGPCDGKGERELETIAFHNDFLYISFAGLWAWP